MKRIALALFALALTASAQQPACYTDEGGSVVCGTTAQQTHTGPTGRQVVESKYREGIKPDITEKAIKERGADYDPWIPFGGKINGTGSVDDSRYYPSGNLIEPFVTTLTCRYAAGVYSYTGHDRVTGQSRVDCSKAVEEWIMTPKGAR